METQFKLSLRNAPGSLGDTARAYASNFSQMVKVHTEEFEEVRNAFHQVLVNRALVYERIGIDDQNLLLPVHIKGLQYIYDLIDPFFIYDDYNYKLDLPSLSTFAMLLESDRKRQLLQAMNYEQITESLEVIYEEVERMCSHQTVCKEKDTFVWIMVRILELFFLKLQSEALKRRGLFVFNS